MTKKRAILILCSLLIPFAVGFGYRYYHPRPIYTAMLVQKTENGRVKITEVQPRFSSRRTSLEQPDELEFRTKVTLDGDKPISRIDGTFYLEDRTGKKAIVPFHIDVAGATGDREFTITKKLNPLIDGDNELQKFSLEDIKITVQLTKLRFEDWTSETM